MSGRTDKVTGNRCFVCDHVISVINMMIQRIDQIHFISVQKPVSYTHLLAFLQRFLPRLLDGFCIGYIFRFMRKKTNIYVSCAVTGFFSAFLNTLFFMTALIGMFAVSYTHLDVYKRQLLKISKPCFLLRQNRFWKKWHRKPAERPADILEIPYIFSLLYILRIIVKTTVFTVVLTATTISIG